MGEDDGSGDGEPEPGAARLARAGRVQAHEGLEDPLDDRRAAMPMPVSCTARTAAVAARASVSSTLPPAGVYLTAFSTRLRSARRSASRRPARRRASRARAARHPACPARAARRLERLPAPAARARRGRRGSSGPRRRAREEQEVLGHADEPVDLLEARRRARCRYSSGVRAARSATSIPPLSAVSGVRSSWAASAVKRRIWPKAALEAREHAVERLGEPVQLVAGARTRDALVQILGGDAAGRRAPSRRPGGAPSRAMSAPPAAASPTPSGIRTTSVSR